VPHAYDGKIIRIPSAQVPRKIWRQAYRVLVEAPLEEMEEAA
jgi:hypothetical protein